jgi:tetratricopeptide (TPR) repeat protein
LDQAEKYLLNSNAEKSSDPQHIVNLNLVLGRLRLEQGREDEAKLYFETCVNAFRKWELHPMPPQQIETLFHLTSIYAKEGRLDEARKMSEWAKRIAEALKGDACFAMASQAEAALLLASGDQKATEEAYLKSLGLWEKAGWPYYYAKTLVAYSDALAQKNPEESRKRLEQAAEIFSKLGAKRDLEKAEAKLSA